MWGLGGMDAAVSRLGGLGSSRGGRGGRGSLAQRRALTVGDLGRCSRSQPNEACEMGEGEVRVAMHCASFL